MGERGTTRTTAIAGRRHVVAPDAADGSFPWATADPMPGRQVRVPLVLSLSGDALGSAVAAHAATAVLPWAPAPSLPLLAFIVAVCLSCYAASGLYDRARLAAPGAELVKTTRAALIALGALLAAAVLFEYVPSRTMLVVGAPLLLGSLVTVRTAIRRVAQHLQHRGLLGTTTLVVGTNEEARAVARTINRTGWLGYRVAGFVRSRDDADQVHDGMPVVGGLDDIADVLAATNARALVVATSDVAVDRLPELVRLADQGVEIRTTCAFRDTNPSRVTVDSLDGIPLLAVRTRRMVGLQRGLKRALDIVLAAGLLLASAPLLALIAVSVRVCSGPGVLFRQERVGQGGRRFTMYKFRTMVPEADDLLDELHGENLADGLLFKLRNDPRITPIGRILRKTDLDELPQLLNVLRGEMSMVGPRPALVRETEHYDEEVARRLQVKPGLTGLWQVSGRHELEWDDYVRYDGFYAENWSVGLDLAICARTVPTLLTRRGQVPPDRHPRRRPRVAIVHDYLTQRGGAERVVLSLLRMFPDADVYTSVYDADGTFSEFREFDIRTTRLQHLPHRGGMARALLPFYGRSFRKLRLSGYDLVLSSSSGFAHGVDVTDGLHVCYCYTPPRFLHRTDAYLGESDAVPTIARPALDLLLRRLRRQDVAAAQRPDVYVGISEEIVERIAVTYGRQAELVHPPVAVGRIVDHDGSMEHGDPYYLMVSRLLPYKKVDVAIRAVRQRGGRLVVVGSGPEEDHLRELGGSCVEFRQDIGEGELNRLLYGCVALIQPGHEDFGLAALEANAAGRPAIAFNAGGARETVIDGVTGVHIDEQSPEAIRAAMDRIEQTEWDAEKLRSHAESFGEERFHASLGELLAAHLPVPLRPATPPAR